MSVKVRFAPSPTGPLHIGGARTVLFNWLYARKHNGVFVLRSEDTDLERSDPRWEEEIVTSLKWLGLNWDEGLEVGGPNGPYRQTQRLEIYRTYLSRLWEGNHAYYCFCSAEQLAADRQAAMDKGETPVYTGRCRHLTPVDVEKKMQQGLRPTVRFRVPPERDIVFSDLIRGEVAFNTREIGDFIIFKSEGIPTYNFAVVIDDITMGITHVIRANEHLVNTPRQILIYRALDQAEPKFAHVSLILDRSGRKMSKRMGDMSVASYMSKGYLPGALVNFLALLGWSPDDGKEVMALEELVERFDLDRVSRSPAIFDPLKLDWINNQHLRNHDLGQLAQLAIPHLEQAGINTTTISRPWLEYVIDVVRDELDNLTQLPYHVLPYLSDEVVVEQQAKAYLCQETTPTVLDEFVRRLKAIELSADYRQAQDQVQSLLKQFSKELKNKAGIGGKAVFMPLRVAITGTTSGQELYYLVPILGVERVLSRIEAARRQIVG